MKFLLVVVLALLATSIWASEGNFFYDQQDEWGGVCVTGNNNEQSPINIETANVRNYGNLTALVFTNWGESYDGYLKNPGSNVQFESSMLEQVTTGNHLGTYKLKQLHMHWGESTGKGSEHRVDNAQAELEIHFVHANTKAGADPSQRDYYTVVGVLADVDTTGSIMGIWKKFNVTAIQDNSNTTSPTTPANGIVLNQLLPSDSSEYYFYEGSLTTPPCSETVQWFMLKNRITVPGPFLDLLRQVQTNEGESLTLNYRDMQDIGGRVVQKGSQAIIKPFIALLISSLLLASFM